MNKQKILSVPRTFFGQNPNFLFFSLVFFLLILVFGCTQVESPPSLPDNNEPSDFLPDANTSPEPVPEVPATGSLQVFVSDASGNPLSSIVVQAYDGQAGEELARLVTNAGGVVLFENLPLQEVYVTAADAEVVVYQPASAEREIEAGETIRVELVLELALPDPEPSPEPEAVLFLVESDDAGFYPSQLEVPVGSLVTLTVKQRTTNAAFGGADIKSPAFATFNVPNGQEKSVSFTVNSNLQIDSYWPSSSVHKATLRVVARLAQ